MDVATRHRRGSETRQKQHRITFRLSEGEHAQLLAAAEREALTIGSYIRSRCLATPTTRAQRRPTIEVQTLASLHGEINKIGSNIHQVLKRINFGETPEGREVHEAFTGCREIIAAIRAAMGREAA